MPANLFSEFNASDKESWKKQIEKELKGKTLDPTNWKVSESVYFEPYYTSTEVDKKKAGDLRSAQRTSTGWLNTPVIHFENPSKTNLNIRTALLSGADAVLLELDDRGLAACELTKTLHSVKLSDSFVYFATDKNPGHLFAEISKGAGYYLKGGIANDPIAQWMRNGTSPENSLEETSRLLQTTKVMKDFRPFMIESHIYHEAGADPVQELAFTLAAMIACIDYLTDHGITALHALNRFFFSVSIGTEYMTEIAKLRALRYLSRKITRAYQLPDELAQASIHARTSGFYHSGFSGETNLLRRTSEAMSAVSGGCDVLTIYDPDTSEESAARIARNVSLLLTNESHMDQVADPAAGSYLIENMSVALVEAAWSLFLEVEEKGGIIRCFEEGFIQEEIEKSWLAKSKLINSKRIMIGVNKYREPGKENFDLIPDLRDTTFQKNLPGLQKRRLERAWIPTQNH